MAGFFQNNGGVTTPREQLESRYNGGRSNLLLVVVFTAINIVLLISQSDTYFLFSAFIPYLIVGFGMMLCGMYPAEYYTDELAGMEFLDKSFLMVTMAISVVLIGLYLLSWFLSKNHRVGWLIFALVFFSLDTLGMFIFNGIQMEMIVDILFHAWVIYSLANGILAHYKLQKLPVEPEAAPVPVEWTVPTEVPEEAEAEEEPAVSE